MIRRTTWILLLMFALTIGAAWVFQKVTQGKTAEETPAAAQNQTLFSIAQNEIASIELEDQYGKEVVIGRDEAGLWKVTEPQGETDISSLQSAISQLLSITVRANVESASELVVFGLSKPAYTIIIKMNNDEMHTMYVGDVTPTQNGYYIQLNNGAPKVVNKYGLDSVLKWITTPPLLPTPTPAIIEVPEATPTAGEVQPSP